MGATAAATPVPEDASDAERTRHALGVFRVVVCPFSKPHSAHRSWAYHCVRAVVVWPSFCPTTASETQPGRRAALLHPMLRDENIRGSTALPSRTTCGRHPLAVWPPVSDPRRARYAGYSKDRELRAAVPTGGGGPPVGPVSAKDLQHCSF